MLVCCFVGSGGLWALSGDEAGANLPADLGPWNLRKVAQLGGTEDDEREAPALSPNMGSCALALPQKST